MKSTAVLGAASLTGTLAASGFPADRKKRTPAVSGIPEGKPALRFRNGEFRILQLTDTHLKYEMPREQAKTFARIRHIVEQEHPDFIALTGDNVTGAGETRKAMWGKYTAFLDGLDIPYWEDSLAECVAQLLETHQ